MLNDELQMPGDFSPGIFLKKVVAKIISYNFSSIYHKGIYACGNPRLGFYFSPPIHPVFDSPCFQKKQLIAFSNKRQKSTPLF